ncbi:MAG: 2-phosphosulfolactate phosphatase [Patescibacteria group bacterium]
MTVNILQRKEGAQQATGLTVVIDVFRAFSTACYMSEQGAERIIVTGDKQSAYDLKEKHPEFILVGERGGHIIPGAQFGNSPWKLSGVDLTGKTIIFTTSAGTKGVVSAHSTEEIITGAFVNAGAIIRYIQSRNPNTVSLVCTGSANEHIADEDAVCARYIKNILLGESNDFEAIVDHLKKEGYANHFFDPARDSHPEEDFALCMALDRFNFVLKAETSEGGVVYLKRI